MPPRAHRCAIPCRTDCKTSRPWTAWLCDIGSVAVAELVLLSLVAIRQSNPPQLHCTSLTEAGSLPSDWVMLSQPSSSTVNPAEFSYGQTRFRFAYTGLLPAVNWHRMRPPGLGSSHFHNVPSPTPRCERMVQMSVNPHPLSAFPRRRYGRLTLFSISRG